MRSLLVARPLRNSPFSVRCRDPMTSVLRPITQMLTKEKYFQYSLSITPSPKSGASGFLMYDSDDRAGGSSFESVVKAPDWLHQDVEQYEITAKIGADEFQAMQKMTPLQRKERPLERAVGRHSSLAAIQDGYVTFERSPLAWQSARTRR
jgi:hypothetical protein